MPSFVQADLSPLRAGTLAPAAPARETPPTATVRKAPLAWRWRQWAKNLLDGSLFIPTLARLARRCGLCVMYSELYGSVTHADGSVTDYGLLGRRVVTTAGVNYLASCFDNTAEPEVMKYHGFGSGTTAEAIGDTALVTEFTTEYATDNTRPTGTQAHSTNTYTTVGVFSPDANAAVTEHGIFSQAANSGGTLWDRTKFSVINLTGSADTLTATYTGTFPSGG